MQSWADGTATSLVAEINPNLKSIRIITTDSPSIEDMAIDSNGNIVTASSNGMIYRIDSSTGVQTQLTTYQYLSFPTGVAFRHNGDIVIFDYQNKRISRYFRTNCVCGSVGQIHGS